MTPQQLAAIGESIYGSHWQGPLAAALGIGLRGMQRWRTGQNPIPPIVAERLQTLAAIAAAGRQRAQQRRAAADRE